MLKCDGLFSAHLVGVRVVYVLCWELRREAYVCMVTVAYGPLYVACVTNYQNYLQRLVLIGYLNEFWLQ